jgi:hypothetical protein
MIGIHLVLWFTSLFMPQVIIGSPPSTIAYQTAAAGTDQTGTSITSVATSAVSTATCVSAGNCQAYVFTRSGTTTFSAPTTSTSDTCFLISGTLNNGANPNNELAYCPSVTSNASYVTTCHFTSQSYDSCIAVFFSGMAISPLDASAKSNAAASGTTMSLGTNTFNTTQAAEAIVACGSYQANNLIFSAGTIAGLTATLAITSGNNSAGTNNDSGCEYVITSNLVSSQGASLNLSGSSTNLTLGLASFK